MRVRIRQTEESPWRRLRTVEVLGLDGERLLNAVGLAFTLTDFAFLTCFRFRGLLASHIMVC